MTKKLKTLVCLMMALALCPFSVTPVLAAGNPILGNEDYPARAAITKRLEVPYGTALPGAPDFPNGIGYTFDIKEVSVYREAVGWEEPIDDLLLRAVPNTMTIFIRGAGANPTYNTTADGITTYIAETSDIFDQAAYTHAGIYKYEITESQNTYPVNTTPPPTEVVTYSGAKYTVSVYVKAKTDGSGYYIYAIATVITIEDNDDQAVGDKVDATPKNPTVNGDYSKMIFTNTYVKTNGGDPEDPDPDVSTLTVSKKVSGDYADETSYFSFSLALRESRLIPDTPTYRAFLMEDLLGDGTYTYVSGDDLINPNKNNAALGGHSTSGHAYITFPVNSPNPVTFKLKHNQKLFFINTPVGTNYDVTEAGTTNYQASVNVTYDNTASFYVNVGNVGVGVGAPNQYVGERVNSADFTNTRDSVTPEGINLNDIPFIGMILLAVASMATYIVLKVRGRRSHTS